MNGLEQMIINCLYLVKVIHIFQVLLTQSFTMFCKNIKIKKYFDNIEDFDIKLT